MPVPDWNLPPDLPLFNVPDKMVKILDRDLKVAGIPKRDHAGKTVDIHALRHTFCTHLSREGIAPRTAQTAMRHKNIKTTMNIYTDEDLLRVKEAINSLPQLPLMSHGPQPTSERTAEAAFARQHAPMLAPDLDKRGRLGAIPDNPPPKERLQGEPPRDDVSPAPVKRKHPPSFADSGCHERPR